MRKIFLCGAIVAALGGCGSYQDHWLPPATTLRGPGCTFANMGACQLVNLPAGTVVVPSRPVYYYPGLAYPGMYSSSYSYFAFSYSHR